MPEAEFSSNPLTHALSSRSIQHILEVLADATHATALLFDNTGQVIAGPIAGNAFGQQLLTTLQGRQAILNAHRSVIDQNVLAVPESELILREVGLNYIAIPVIREEQRHGTLTLGGRPIRPLSVDAVGRIASAVGLAADDLRQAATDMPLWEPEKVSVGRNVGALIVELLADIRLQDEDLRRRLDEQSTVYSLTGLLAGTTDLQQILNTVAHRVCEVMKVKACSIRLLDEVSGDLAIKAVHNLSNEYLNKGPVTVAHNPIDQAALSGEMVRIADAPSDPRTRYPEQARKESIVSGLVCGMIYRGKAVGVLRAYTGHPHTFSPHEEALLQAVASQAAAAIVNARLMTETIKAERNARQIAYAGAVQRRMIPEDPPENEHVEIGALYRPTHEVGGDFYDFIPLPNGNLGLVIADVSGKGVPASLLMASLRSLFRVYANFTYHIDRILSEVNKHMCQDTTIGEFATAFYGVLMPNGRRLTYSNAGHDPPMLLRDGQIQYLETGGMVLGVDPATTFDRGLLSLRPGDVLLLHTDGAVEATNFADEQFGRKRLASSLIRYADQPAQRIVHNINWDLRRFRGLADRTDDLSLVVIKIK